LSILTRSFEYYNSSIISFKINIILIKLIVIFVEVSNRRFFYSRTVSNIYNIVVSKENILNLNKPSNIVFLVLKKLDKAVRSS
jgi:hypothetical protein